MTDHANFVGVDPQPLRDTGLETIDELAWFMDRQLVARPEASRGKKFDRVVMLCWCCVLGVDQHISDCECSFGVAFVWHFLMLVGNLGCVLDLDSLGIESRA